jgi:hypothetical protein
MFIEDKYKSLLPIYESLFATIPPYQGLRIFVKGLSHPLNHTGINFGSNTSLQASEYKEIFRFLYPLLCIVFQDVTKDPLVTKALDSLWHFIGFYQSITSKTHTETTLKVAEYYLLQFQAARWEVFLEYQPSNFAFPKNHSMVHYILSIRRKGRVATTDTQHGERAHKDIKEMFKGGNKKYGFEKRIADVETMK